MRSKRLIEIYEPIAHCSKDPDPPYYSPPRGRQTSNKRKNKSEYLPEITTEKSRGLIPKPTGSTTSKGLNKKKTINKNKKSHNDLIIDTTSVKNNENTEDPFDKLLKTNDKTFTSPTAEFTRTKHPRTYSNRRNSISHEVLEFHDHKNREMILEWLNKYKDNFSIITPSQQENYQDHVEHGSPLTLDMPSVSQAHTANNRNNRNPLQITITRNLIRSRAKSLDLENTKTLIRLRSRSIAGDDPNLENYDIEDAVSEEDLVLNDLMEDQCLQELEREFAVNDKQKDCDKKSSQGWERVKEMRKIIKKTNRTPKKLNITLQTTPKSSSPIKDLSSEILARNRSKRVLKMPSSSSENTQTDEEKNKIAPTIYPTYNLESFEDYFQQHSNIQEFNDDKPSSNECSAHVNTALSPQKRAKPDVVSMGKTFLECVGKMTKLEVLTTLQPIILELDTIFNKFGLTSNEIVPIERKHVEIQTLSNCFIDTETITDEIIVKDMGVQTESAIISIETHETPEENGKIGDSLDSINFDAQDVEKTVVPLETSKNEEMMTESLDFVQFDTQEELKKNSRQKNEEHSQNPKRKKKSLLKSQDFEVELTGSGRLKGYYLRSKSSIETPLKAKSPLRRSLRFNKENDSPLICSDRSSQNLGKSQKVKNVFLKSLENKNSGKRPCQKFINEDLSLDFDSNSQHSDDKSASNRTIRALRKSQKNVCKDADTKVPEIKTSQELIAHCDEIIYNATKRQVVDDPCSDEIFNSHSLFLDEENLVKIQSDISNYEAKTRNEDHNLSLCDVIAETEALRLLKTSRKRLFDEVQRENGKDLIETEENLPKKHQPSRIIILEDIRVKSPVQNEEISSQISEVLFPTQSEVDLIETTPQKRCPSFKKTSILDITLPPPVQFRDIESQKSLCEDGIEIVRPLGYHSTPRSGRGESESLHMSPITQGSDRRSLGAYELAQKSQINPFVVKKSIKSQQLLTPTATKQNSIMQYVQPVIASQKTECKPCVACTLLPKTDTLMITMLVKKKLIDYSPTFEPAVTHMIVKVDENNRVIDHTAKYLLAVASGIWVVSVKWILDCLDQNRLVPEEPYEALDQFGVDGPKKSRLLRKFQPLFKGFKFHVAPPFTTSTKKDIEHVIKLLGGVVVADPGELLDQNGFTCLILCEGIALPNLDICDTWLDVLRVATVDVTWLISSVAQYKVNSFYNHILCSDESIHSLGYPQFLLEKVPYSCSTIDNSMDTN